MKRKFRLEPIDNGTAYLNYVSSDTKLAASIRYYNENRYYADIFEAYERPSVYKVEAWNYCKKMCDSLNGWNCKIVSKNTMQFSVCFSFVHPEHGHICIAYITKDHNRYTDL